VHTCIYMYKYVYSPRAWQLPPDNQVEPLVAACVSRTCNSVFWYERTKNPWQGASCNARGIFSSGSPRSTAMSRALAAVFTACRALFLLPPSLLLPSPPSHRVSSGDTARHQHASARSQLGSTCVRESVSARERESESTRSTEMPSNSRRKANVMRNKTVYWSRPNH
jgi:hypothetical protein